MDPRFKRHVRDRFGADADALSRAMEAVKATVASPGWELIQELLRTERGTVDSEVENPSKVLDHASYAMAHGYRAGLNASARAAQTLVEFAEVLIEDQRRRHEGVPAGTGAPREGSNGQ